MVWYGLTRVFVPPTGLRAIVAGDIHFPYHEPAALELFLQIVDRFQPQVVILNGDVVDFAGISRFVVPPDVRAKFVEDVKGARDFFQWLHQRLDGRTVWLLEGNHERRLWRYVVTRAPELFELEELHWWNVLGVHPDWNIASSSYEQSHLAEPNAPSLDLGGYLIMHGDALRVTPTVIGVARAVLLRTMVPTIVGHWHRNDHWSTISASGHYIACWAVGALCLQRPSWDSGRIFQQGVLTIEFAGDQDTHLPDIQLVPFHHDVGFKKRRNAIYCWWRGELLSASAPDVV